MDEIDKQILTLLQEDSKITNAQLAKEISLSPASTLERVRKLEINEFIQQYTIKINKKKLNIIYSFLVYVKLNLQTEEVLNNFIDKIQDIPEVIKGYHTSGHADFILEISTIDTESYTNLIIQQLSRIEGVKSIKGDLIFKKVKDSGIKV